MHNGLGGGHEETVGLPAGSGWAIMAKISHNSATMVSL